MADKPRGPVSERLMRKFYGPSGFTPVQAEGARVGFIACPVCGAAVMFDPRDSQSAVELHAKWHEEHKS